MTDNIHAWDKKDALVQIGEVLAEMGERCLQDGNKHDFEFARIVEDTPPEERGALIAEAVLDEFNRLLAPEEPGAYSISTARKIFRPSTPPSHAEVVAAVEKAGVLDPDQACGGGWTWGAEMRIAKDAQQTAWVAAQPDSNENTIVAEARKYGRYVHPSDFWFRSTPIFEVPEDKGLWLSRHDIREAVSLVIQEIVGAEDAALWMLAKASAEGVDSRRLPGDTRKPPNNVTMFPRIDVEAFWRTAGLIDRWHLVTEAFVISRQALTSIIQHMSNDIEPCTERANILAGLIGWFDHGGRKIPVYTASGYGVEEVVPANTIAAYTDGIFAGAFGLRVQPYAEPFDMVKDGGLQPKAATHRGVVVRETGAMVISNPVSVAYGVSE